MTSGYYPPCVRRSKEQYGCDKCGKKIVPLDTHFQVTVRYRHRSLDPLFKPHRYRFHEACWNSMTFGEQDDPYSMDSEKARKECLEMDVLYRSYP